MSGDVDVRETLRCFPDWTQNFWTWFTGKALPHQAPLIRHTWWSYLATTLTVFSSGLAVSAAALVFKFDFWVPALLAGWILTLAAARTMILVIAHQCIHNQFSGVYRVDRFVGELVTVLTVYQDLHAFKVEHFDAHHRDTIFATVDDPPVQVLMGLGFCPGMSRRQLWRRAAIVFVSPRFYWNGFVDRIKCNLLTGTWRRAGFFVWAAGWLSLPLWLHNGGQVLLLGFVVPVIPMAQLSALLDKLGEHAWLTPPNPEHGRRNYHVEASWARFCGSPAPDPSLPLVKKLLAWPTWAAAMLFYHLPSRLLVVVGDLPNHDFHHRFPGTTEWTIAAYARQRDIDGGCSGGPPYTEVWGMGQAIDQMFTALSKVPTFTSAAAQTAAVGAAPEASAR